MPGDEPQQEGAAVDAGRPRGGPRHAAPRKPLLTRLHMPAGKAIAMAAMPSAVLMGMGLTPQLANAKPLPKNPFKDGPCVAAPEKEEPKDPEAEDRRPDQPAKDQKEAAKDGKEGGAERSGGSRPSTESPDSSVSAESNGQPSGADDPRPEPSPSPSESESDNPLDPLGIGDKIRDFLTPGEEKQRATEPESTPSPSASGESDSGSGPVRDTVDKVEKGVEDATDAAGDATGEATESPSPSPSSPEEDTRNPDEAGPGDEGKQPFPCVKEKHVEGEDEQTPVVLPNKPWKLKASTLALHGLDYKGVFNVTTANGTTKQVLKFTAESVDIGDLHQIVPGPNGTKYHVRAAEGSTSTIRGGTVTMYTERLEGNLFGLIPIVFDPEHPPPLNIPEVYFTDAEVTQAGQFGGTLTVPGLHQTIEG